MKKDEQQQVITLDLRETLKQIIKNEIEKLPQTLATLEPQERLNVLCKLLPYVFPKVEAVHITEGEPWKVKC